MKIIDVWPFTRETDIYQSTEELEQELGALYLRLSWCADNIRLMRSSPSYDEDYKVKQMKIMRAPVKAMSAIVDGLAVMVEVLMRRT